MKGLIYGVAFAIGLAAGPTTLGRSQADTVKKPGKTPGVSLQQASATIVIDAPTKGRVGELIRFDLTKSDADSIKWLLKPGSADFESYNDGRRAVFSARTAGEYMFIIAVAKGGTVDVVTHTVKIEGPPEKPESQSLADWIPYWLYDMQLPREEALALAQSFEETAERITALSTPQGIIEATGEANRVALGGSLEAWKPLLQKVKTALETRAKANTLTTPDQHKEAWREIAQGLRKYAQ